MSNNVMGPSPLPVNLKGLQERKLLQAELIGHDAQLRNFTPLRDRLLASGQDATAMYRKIQSRRDQVAAELNKLMPAPVRSAGVATSASPLGGSVLTLPIPPFQPSYPGPWFGYSGKVQMGQAAEGVNVLAHGQYPTSGSIATYDRNQTGGILFEGNLVVGPDEAPPSEYDPGIQYFWLHNWYNLIPFPAAVVKTTFTYSFDVKVMASLLLNSGPATFMSFVSVGETSNFVDQDVVVDTDAGWPLMVDLMQPYLANGSTYNGHLGSIQGRSTVQRSFIVEAGHIPAVALVLGVVSGQAMMSEVDCFLGPSCIVPAPSMDGSSDGLVNFHYGPVPPDLHP